MMMCKQCITTLPEFKKYINEENVVIHTNDAGLGYSLGVGFYNRHQKVNKQMKVDHFRCD